MYQIEIYENKNGESEIEDYIQNLRRNQNKNNNIKFTKIIAYIRMLRENGLALGIPYVKHLEGEIWELRPLRNRILFAYIKNDKFVLLNMFVKKMQKTPKKEIEKAKRLLKDYIDRSW